MGPRNGILSDGNLIRQHWHDVGRNDVRTV